MLTYSTSLIFFQSLLTVCAIGLAVSGLRLLQRIEAYMPPVGASRIANARQIGDSFPWDIFPRQFGLDLRHKTVLLLFSSDHCCVCTKLAPAISGLIRAYNHVQFVICSKLPVDQRGIRGAVFVQNTKAFHHLKIAMIPYAIKIESGVIVDFGIVNSCEQLESVLDAVLEQQ